MFTFKEIDKLLNYHSYQWKNKQNCNFDKASNINQAMPNSICWIKNGSEAVETLLNTLQNCCVVLPYEVTVPNLETSSNSFIFCEDPKYIYSLIVNELFVEKLIPTIHPTAIIHPEAHLGSNVYIGPYVEIGRCKIGNNVVIHSHTKLHDKTQIGDNVTINSCVVIGGDGFGYSSNKRGVESIKFPHLGGVIIENDVEIGSNTCIDKGALGNTVIRKNVKIDNLVHIAHNVVIDENTFVIAHTIIGGSTTIGKNSWIAPNVSILNGLVIGDFVTVGMGSVVTKNIPNNEVWAGNPAKPTQEIKAYNQKINQILKQL